MKQFIAGILTASLIWAGVFIAQAKGVIDLFGEEEVSDQALEPTAAASSPPLSKKAVKKRGKRRRPRRGGNRTASGNPMPANTYDLSEGMAGDALDGPGGKSLSMGSAGGEDQLSPGEIDQGIDRVFKGIERCLLTLPPDAPATGKVVFGMNIASSGRVTKVNLRGPNVMIKGETGACFRRTVKSIRFRSFDGPDMVAHYPVVFD
jgi:hypothetical protein